MSQTNPALDYKNLLVDKIAKAAAEVDRDHAESALFKAKRLSGFTDEKVRAVTSTGFRKIRGITRDAKTS